MKRLKNLLSRTPFRTFVLYPVFTAVWAVFHEKGFPDLRPAFILLLLWGYLQYDLCGRYRTKHGGGGPGVGTLPDRLVTTGPFAYTRNPMYLGHLIFLTGLSLFFRSYLAAFFAVGTAIWMHRRVLRDEERLRKLFGDSYDAYASRVKRWIPALF